MEKETKKTAEKAAKTTRTRKPRKTPEKEKAAVAPDESVPAVEEQVQDVMPESPAPEPAVADAQESFSWQESGESPAAAPESDYDAEQKAIEQEIAQERSEERIAAIVETQRNFFATNRTKDISWRIEQLKKLYNVVSSHQEDIAKALYDDLNKSAVESYVSEIGIVLHEISLHIRKLKRWSRERRMQGDLFLMPSKLRVFPEPYGVVLVMATWNYPFMLSIQPLIAAMSAGNTIVLKTSEYSTATSALLDSLISKNFNSEYITVVNGGYLQNHALLNQHFDFIFFTGSQNVGKIVMSNAARFLTPVCLELGGKSPCIVDDTADIPTAARRIVWGKFLNAGQTCVAPDYILVDQKIKKVLLATLQEEIKRQFGENPLANKEYPKIINERHFVHLSTLYPSAEMDFITNKIAPTIIDLCDIHSPELAASSLMQEEIFGPLLPVISYQDINDAIAFVAARPLPLALYLFSSDKQVSGEIVKTLRYGGGCINDVVCHIASSKIPFGGVGESGMGNYHGRYGFETFSHYKSILERGPRGGDNYFRYAPHKPNILSFVRKVLR